MGVIFKKNGRPTKEEKTILKNINGFLSSLDSSERDKYDFNNETVNNGKRLKEIWGGIMNPNDNVDIETGEIKAGAKEIKSKQNTAEKMENNQEDVNFTTNKTEDSMEDAEIMSEVSEGNDEIPKFFNPLGDPIKQRRYTSTEQTNVGEIEEPTFEAEQSATEQLQEIEEEKDESVYEEEFAEEDEDLGEIRNPKMEELDDKDKKLAAKQLVQTVLDGYEMLHELGKAFVKYPEEKLQEKIIKKEIDPTMEIPLDEQGTTTNPVEFFQNFNEQAEEAISYDPEFGEKVRPAMERVFAKKGWGMTDEQYLLVAFGKDIAWKSVQIMTLKKTAKGIMNTFEELQKEKIAAMRQQARAEARQAPPVQPDAIVTPPTREPIIEDPIEDAPQEPLPDDNEIVPIH